MSARATSLPHQPRPNRRYRRLLPTALAVAALAATGSTLGASPARAAGGGPPPQRAHHHARPATLAVVPRTETRGDSAAAHVSAN
jgi:Spy/CpxP family protein refolding chaperone